jgi:3D (Asp-Asp-Asp) domain-containing protein
MTIKSLLGKGLFSAACLSFSIFLTAYAAPSLATRETQENNLSGSARMVAHETLHNIENLTTRPTVVETRTESRGTAETINESAAQTFTATAYCLRGRTASGRMVARGIIAADPRVLPLGTRVRLQAGAHTGEYIVADTGGLIRGRRIDIWMPSSGEALRFGRRNVRLTVLQYGGRRGRTAPARIASR